MSSNRSHYFPNLLCVKKNIYPYSAIFFHLFKFSSDKNEFVNKHNTLQQVVDEKRFDAKSCCQSAVKYNY